MQDVFSRVREDQNNKAKRKQYF